MAAIIQIPNRYDDDECEYVLHGGGWNECGRLHSWDYRNLTLTFERRPLKMSILNGHDCGNLEVRFFVDCMNGRLGLVSKRFQMIGCFLVLLNQVQFGSEVLALNLKVLILRSV